MQQWFYCRVVTVNYENSKFSISMPVFSIHGNHDDNTGVSSKMKLLADLDFQLAMGQLRRMSGFFVVLRLPYLAHPAVQPSFKTIVICHVLC